MTENEEDMEREEISTAKDIVWDVLDTEHQNGLLSELPEDTDFIGVSDKIVEALITAGVYIPVGIERREGFYEMSAK